MQIPSGKADDSKRAAILIASPYKLSSVIIISPIFIPALNVIFSFSFKSLFIVEFLF